MDFVFLFYLGIAFSIAYYYTSRRPFKRVPPTRKRRAPARGGNTVDSPTIEPLTPFNWATTPPRKFRPFKPIYHITMALEHTMPSDLIVIDSNYLSRIQKRRFLLAHHPSTAHGSLPQGTPPINELYTYLLVSYLPARYPALFALHSGTFHNSLTNTTHPATPPEDPLRALRIMAETVEDDLFLLLEGPEGHRCVAFACCFPSGFNPSSKLGKVLAEIHAPVPGYEKIESSMERFFKRLEVGRSVKRINWFVTAAEDLFNPGHTQNQETPKPDQEIGIETAQVRMELQTLTRLPTTSAILFSFKTHLYPLREIKEEGLGPRFADAIEGLKKGNAPGMWGYKGADRWGARACEYLRS